MRTLLVLARVSNLPTVWSNCLAAWLLSGGKSWSRFGMLCLGATLLYTGGMYLNDAVDQDFDRRYRSERPIIAGHITARAVWILSVIWLVVGYAVFLWMGKPAAVTASALLLTIVAYDLVHKRTVLAPLLMASCRFLLYILAAAVADASAIRVVLPGAIALGAYIVGLSYLARRESTGGFLSRWPWVLLAGPAIMACALTSREVWLWGALAIHVGWLVWCLWPSKAIRKRVPQGVAGLLGGIALVDLLATAGQGYPGAFIGLFLLAIVMQRIAPAT